MGDVAALIAPRPQFIAWGGRDPLTPEAAMSPALSRVRGSLSRRAGARRPADPTARRDTGHEETPAMRAEALAFLARWLG
jgi:hypothetical protein